MLKRIGILSAAMFSLVVGAGPAGAQSGTIAYTYYWYSDASLTTQVGEAYPRCFNGNITYRVVGTRTSYEVQEAAYICGSNGPEPLE